ncbi:MAG: hypothetical protein HY998_03755 [candidate division NC10 bacterium]|nr:hypothetical protein [candidate division NC10 bacterium]
MKILHIIRDPREQLALEVARYQADSREVSLLLIQDGVLADLMLDLPVYALTDDMEARGIQGRYLLVSYPEVVRLIFEHDKVIIW